MERKGESEHLAIIFRHRFARLGRAISQGEMSPSFKPFFHHKNLIYTYLQYIYNHASSLQNTRATIGEDSLKNLELFSNIYFSVTLSNHWFVNSVSLYRAYVHRLGRPASALAVGA